MLIKQIMVCSYLEFYTIVQRNEVSRHKGSNMERCHNIILSERKKINDKNSINNKIYPYSFFKTLTLNRNV